MKEKLNLPAGWEMKTLGDLFEITSSKRVFKEDWKTDGVPFYRAREIVKLAVNGFVNNELFISEEMFKEYSEKYGLPKTGDIMVTGVGTLGICYVVKSDDRFYFKDGNIIWLKSNGKTNSRYVEYAFKSDFLRNQIDDSIGATVGTYTIIKAKNTKIPIPPLPEQHHIVSTLDKAFAAIDKAKANTERCLNLSKELFESYLQGVFANKGDGWEEKKLGELIEYEKKQNKYNGLPYVGLEHIESNSGKFLGSLEPQEVKSATFIFNEQHVLYGRLRPYLNKVLIPDFKGHCSTEIFPIKVKKEIIREFLFYWLISGTTVKKIDSTWTGARMPRANMNQVLDFDFAYPPIIKQQTIVRQLDTLRAETQKLEAVYQKKIDALEELKKSILAKAFAGELETKKVQHYEL
jgi:type I restriction enzyme, S subunit